MALADVHGVDGLSMRKLGQELGVEAMSLYNHVANKSELLDELVERVASEYVLPMAGPNWKHELRATAIGAHGVLVIHPWAAALTFSRSKVGVARLGFAEAVLGCFRTAGFSAQLAHHALHAYEGHIIGFTLQSLERFTGEGLGPLITSVARGELAEQYPWVTDSIANSTHDEEQEFAIVLDLILDGLDLLHDAQG